MKLLRKLFWPTMCNSGISVLFVLFVESIISLLEGSQAAWAHKKENFQEHITIEKLNFDFELTFFTRINTSVPKGFK